MALQDLINASTGLCQLGAETYTTTAPVTVNRPMVIRGQGPAKTSIMLVGSTQDGLVVTTVEPVTIADLKITATAGKTGGYGIKFASTGLNTDSRLDNLVIESQNVGVGMLNAMTWVLSNSYIVNTVGYGVHVDNPLAPDSGDACITNCTMDTSQPNANAIMQESGGGLKVIGNKILRHVNGYAMVMKGNTSVLILSANSFEWQSQCGVILVPNGGTFGLVTIHGNEFGIASGCLGIQVIGSSWCDRMSVVGNVGSIAAGGGWVNINIPNLVGAGNMVI